MPDTPSAAPFRVVAIPLNRAAIVRFLTPPQPTPRGHAVRIVAPRPTAAAERAWAERLRHTPTVAALLSRHAPTAHLRTTPTDRLVPAPFLRDDPAYLTRAAGGWSPVWFGVMQGPLASPADDPVLQHAEVITTYGPQIPHVTARPSQVARRLPVELGTASIQEAAAGIVRMHDARPAGALRGAPASLTGYADMLYAQLADAGTLTRPRESAPPVPRAVLVNELLGQMARIEMRRRQAVARGDDAEADALGHWQARVRADTGLMLLLKGEYIMGRHRCSTVLIAPELDLVAKQPGPEPFHEIALDAATHNGHSEHRPALTRNGALVTAAGRLRLILDEGLVEPLNRLFGHDVRMVSSLGLIHEPHVAGPTLKAYVEDAPERLTPALYETVLVHQLVCEHVNVENGDWHAANFIVQPGRTNPLREALGNRAPALTHIDWGAARPLTEAEQAGDGATARMNQVKNIAYSYDDASVAARSRTLHNALVADSARLRRLRQRARRFAEAFVPASA